MDTYESKHSAQRHPPKHHGRHRSSSSRRDQDPSSYSEYSENTTTSNASPRRRRPDWRGPVVARLELLCPVASYSTNGAVLPLQPVLRVVDHSGAILVWDRTVVAKVYREILPVTAEGKITLESNSEAFATGTAAEPNTIGLVVFTRLAFIGEPGFAYSIIFSSEDCEPLVVSGIQVLHQKPASPQQTRNPEATQQTILRTPPRVLSFDQSVMAESIPPTVQALGSPIPPVPQAMATEMPPSYHKPLSLSVPAPSAVTETQQTSPAPTGGPASPLSLYTPAAANTLGSRAFRGHPSHEVMRAMQEGIINAVGSDPVEVLPHLPLAAKEFKREKITRCYRRTKSTLPGGAAVASIITGSHVDERARFQFIDYSPTCFKYIRALFGIQPDFYLRVLGDVWTTATTPGKSNALLYFAGREYVIKTMKSSESKFLRSILLKYFLHVQANPNTLITRFYGHHRLTALWGKKVKIDFIVMNNVLQTELPIHLRFDLKGSTYERAASAHERAKRTCIYKDNDIMEMQRKINVGKASRTVVIQQLRSDVSFLQACKIMDYSLLLGVHNLAGGGCPTGGVAGGIQSETLPEVYFIGVIDILQKFNAWKKAEHRWRGWRTKQKHAISAVPPKEYGERFLNFMSKLFT